MGIRWFFIAIAMLVGGICSAQLQSDNPSTDTQLNLEQFNSSESTGENNGQELQLDLNQFENEVPPADANLELNLEQFQNNDANTPELVNPQSNDSELNLEQFENGDAATKQINNDGSKATRVDQQPAPQRKGYSRALIVGGLLFMFFLIYRSRSKRRSPFDN